MSKRRDAKRAAKEAARAATPAAGNGPAAGKAAVPTAGATGDVRLTPASAGPISSSGHATDEVLRELSDAFGTGTGRGAAADAAVAAAAGSGSDRKMIVIDSDDLPDPVYLDEDDPNRIVIQDDSFDDNPARATTGTSASVDPRMRARRIAVRRAEGRKRLLWAIVALVVVALVLGVLAVLGSGLFSIDEIDVEGAVYSDQKVVQDVVDSLRGEPILTADLDAAERRLEALAWVRDARVTMDFPHRVLIEIDERDPLAYFRGADGWYRVLDVEGQVLAVIKGKPVDYVEITGGGPDLAPGEDAGGIYRGAAQLANALPPSLRPRVTNLGITDSGEITMVVDGMAPPPAVPITVAFGPPEDYQEKLVALVNELARHEPGDISQIDVSTGSPIVG